jgi:hypothetical protein
MRLSLQRNRIPSFTLRFVSRFLAVFILSSFLVTLVPIASTAAADTMPCCVGKAEGHCDSGLLAPQPPPPPVDEPMCGLASVLGRTSRSAETTAAHAHAESNSSQITAAESVGSPCQMDCGACATVSSRHKRQKDLILARIADPAPSTTITRFDNPTFFYSSNENWTRINPRGPPSVR